MNAKEINKIIGGLDPDLNFHLIARLKKAQALADNPATTEPLVEDEQSVNRTQPYLDTGNTLVIPFESDSQYHWWNGGQSVIATLIELNAPKHIIEEYRF